jgi:glycosyltransferase involved in cell wall biosynthesis
MKICVYAEPMRARTSGTPARGLMKTIVSMFPEHEFVLVIRRGSEHDAILRQALAECASSNVTVVVASRPRKLVNLLCLLGVPGYARLDVSADVYINLDLDYLGPTRTPTIVTVADLSAEAASTSSLRWHGNRMRRNGLRMLARSKAHVVAMSAHTANALVRFDAGFRERVTVIHVGIAPEWFTTPTVARPAERSPYWLWWGHIAARKNVHRLVRAYARLLTKRGKETVPRLVLVATPGAGANEVQELARRLGVSESVEIVPPCPLPQLIGWVDGSHGVVFPSLYEGFGLPVVEAFARGRPVMTSNVTSLPEVAGGHGILCDPTDEGSIEAGLRRLSEHSGSHAEECGRREWASRFSYEEAARRYEALAREVTR